MRSLSIGVIIATKGRRDEAASLIRHLNAQTRLPERVILVVGNLEDAPNASGVEVVLGPIGLAAQRNTGLKAAEGLDLVVFYDDDFVPAPGALEAIERLFTARPDIVGATGHVAADGATVRTISEKTAVDICQKLHLTPPPLAERRVIGLYGCNG